MVAAAQRAATTAGLARTNPAADAALTTAGEILRDARVLDEDITTFVERFTSPDAVALAHRRQRHYTADIKTAIDTIKALTNGILPQMGEVPRDLDAAVSELQDAEQKTGLRWDLETLRRLERKYGFDSAKLNALEVLAAYGVQRVPAFGIGAGGRPGPLEVVLAYAPTYLTRSDDKMRMAGIAEIGLRHYFFGEKWGGSGKLAWLRPGYSSYGLAWAGRSDDPLTPPWQGESRFGAFVGWGQLKIAWLAGHDKRILVTQQIQIIPWVF